MILTDLSKATFLFAHGAGAGMDSDFILQMSALLENKGLQVKTFEFPYMQKIRTEGKRRPPDRMPKLLIAFQHELESLCENQFVFIGGKSMGGRVASLLAAANEGERKITIRKISGVICLGFPFHPPKKIEKYRGEHLMNMSVDTLIVQGERDTFGTQAEIESYNFSESVQVEILPDGDHSFKPRVRSGVTLEQNLIQCADLIIDFVETQLSRV